MTLDATIQKVRRFNYNGQRKFMITSPVDGLLEPIYPTELFEMMNRLIGNIDCSDVDYVIGLDSGGIIPGLSVSIITGLPLRVAYKANLDIENKIHFVEEHSANPDIYIYNLPKNSRVLLTDDEIRTGGTIMNCVDSLVGAGNSVRGIVVPVESTLFNVRGKLSEMGYELCSYVKHEF